MMQQDERGATPSELQTTILKSLLAAKQEQAEQAVNLEPLAKELIPSLLNVLARGAKDITMSLGDHESTTMHRWRESLTAEDILIAMAKDALDEEPNFVSVKLALISDLLTVALGGKIQGEQLANARAPSRMELRFIQQLAPLLGASMQRMVKAAPKSFAALTVADKKFPERMPDDPACLLQYTVEIAGRQHSFSLVIAKNSMALAAKSQSKKTDEPNVRTNVASEIGRTAISVDVIVRLVDQTLERLHSLKSGDIIPLSPTSLTETKMLVRGHEIFVGQLGKTGQHYSFKVAKQATNKSGGLSHMVQTLTEQGKAK